MSQASPRESIVQWYAVARRSILTDDWQLIDGVCSHGSVTALVEAGSRNWQKPGEVLELHHCKTIAEVNHAKTLRYLRGEAIRECRELFGSEVLP